MSATGWSAPAAAGGAADSASAAAAQKANGAAGWSLAQGLALFRRELVVVGVFSAVANLMMLVPTLYMLQVYDRVLISGSELTLLAVSLMALFLYAIMAVAEWSRSRVLVRVGVRMNDALAERVFRASFDAHVREPSLMPARPLRDLTELRQFLTGTGPIAAFDAPWLPIYLAVLFVLHPVLGWAGVGFAVLQSAVAWWVNRRALEPAKALERRQSETVAHVQAKLRMSEAVQSMGMLEGLYRRWQRLQAAYLAQHRATHGQQFAASAWSKGLRYAQQSLMLGVGALLVIDGEMTAGAMIAANVLATRALAPIDMLVGSWKGFLSAWDAYQRLSRLLAEHGEDDPALTRVPPSGPVVLRGVWAAAPASGADAPPILRGVELTLHPGEITVVMGPSGSGKSTLAKVLLDIWPARAGEVLWGERPMAAWTPEERGAHVGYLAQDVELFDGTMADNIARMGAVDGPAVIAAAQMAGLHETILRMPAGYDTPVASIGGVLSGGQRQRLGLARALYGSPRLVVLDEPNANLDEAGEAALMHAMLQLKARGVAVMAISHRPGLLRVADRLVWLQGGQIDHSGARDEVLARLQAKAASAQSSAASAASSSVATAPVAPAVPSSGVAAPATPAPPQEPPASAAASAPIAPNA